MTKTYGFRVYQEDFAESPSVVVSVLARDGDKEFPVNPSSDGERTWDGAPKALDNCRLQGLHIRLWWTPEHGWTEPNVWLDGGSHMNARDVDRLAKTFARVNRAIAKANAREAGDVLMALASAIGATWTVTELGEKQKWSFYSDRQWRFSALTDARDHLRSILAERPLHGNREAA